jgi:hypothetical protein
MEKDSRCMYGYQKTKVYTFRSVYQASQTLSADRRTINNYLDTDKLYRGKYYLTSYNKI